MSLVLIKAGCSGPSRVRSLSVPAIACAAGLLALVLLGAGAAGGYRVGGGAGTPGDAAAPLEQAAADAHPAALERLGELSGRLFRLESLAAELNRRLVQLQKVEPRARDAERASRGGSGGPWLPPHEVAAAGAAAAPASVAALDAQLRALDDRFVRVSDATARHGERQMRMPTREPVADADLTSRFGNRFDPFSGRRAFHAGLDSAAEAGSPIRATGGGTVTFAGWRAESGNTVEIDHGNGLATRYAHASRLHVPAGRIVVPGEHIADVGSTGRSTGAHLHYEVLRDGALVDPKLYLAAR